MFDLEQSIADWRAQMLAAGIASPVPLEELESHLRDEIEQHMNAGLDASSAFALAVEKVGKPQTLKSEFRRAGGLLAWLGTDTNSRVIRVLSIYWLIISIWGVFNGAISIGSLKNQNGGLILPVTFIIYECLFIRMIIASFRLLRGDSRDRRLIWLVNLLFTLVLMFTFTTSIVILNSLIDSVWYYLDLTATIATLWFLRPTRKIKHAS